MSYGFDRASGRLRPSNSIAQKTNGKYKIPEIKKTSIVIPTKESSEQFIMGQVHTRVKKVKQSNLPMWLFVGFCSYTGYLKWRNYKKRANEVAEKKLLEQQKQQQKDS